MNSLRTFFYGQSKPDYHIGAALYCRGIGLIYLIALVSWWAQVEVLIGENGLVSAKTLLEFLDQRFSQTGNGSRWDLPSLLWLTGASGAAIHSLCAIGCLFAVLAIVGIIQGPALIGCWLIYLSFVTTGDTFMSFQWDILLLETGVLAVLLSSWKIREKLSSLPSLSLRRKIALFLCWFLIAKLMFLSGWVKLAWASPAQPEWWPAHTAMTYHYQTQPIPTWTAWFAHQLPEWFHKLSIWPVYFIELVLPFFIIFGHRFKLIAGVGFTLLMLLILLTGNYTYFNWLTIFLCLPLIADQYWPKKWRNNHTPNRDWKIYPSLVTAVPVMILLALLNLQVVATNLNRAQKPLIQADLSPKWLDSLAGKFSRFYLCSGYGLFRTMTTDRPEIILQGSRDGITWKTYDFHWKPDQLNERPRFVAPHQPRVAWQFWFAALERQYRAGGRNSRWLEALIVKTLNGDPTTNALFRENPFPDQPPTFLRAKLYLYEFTDFSEKRNSGNWWKRTDAGTYIRDVRLPQP